MADPSSKLDILISITSRLEELAKARAAIKGTKDEALSLGEALKMGVGIEGIRRGVDIAVATFKELVLRGFEAAKQVKELAENLTIGKEALQVFMGAAEEKAPQMVQALRELKQNSVEARDGNLALAESFRNLSLDAGQLALLPLEDQMTRVAFAMVHATDQQRAYNDAVNILGRRNAPQLMDALRRLGTDGYGKLRDEIKQTYGLFDDADIERIAAAKQKLEQFKARATVASAKAAGDILDLDPEALDEAIAVVGKAAGWVMAFGKGLGYAAGAVATDAENALRGGVDRPSLSQILSDSGGAPEVSIVNKRGAAGTGVDPQQKDLNLLFAERIELQSRLAEVANSGSMTENKRRTENIYLLGREAKIIEEIIALKYQDVNIDTSTATGLKLFAEKKKLEDDLAALKAQQTTLKTGGVSAFDRSKDIYEGINDPARNPDYMTANQGLMAGFMDWSSQVGSVGEQISQTLTGTIGGAISTVSQGITGLITGTATWGDMGRSMGLMFLQTLVQIGVQMAAQGVISTIVTALHIGNEGKKTAATLSGAATRAAAFVAETAKSLVHAAIGAMEAMASIPYVGPILAIAAMGAILAAGSSLISGRENGGEVRAGVPYIVGEKRPEVFVPTQNGTIIPSVDRYRVMGGASAGSAGVSRAGGTSGAMPIQEGRRERSIVFTGDLMRARNLMRDSDWDNVFIDAARRTRGEVLA